MEAAMSMVSPGSGMPMLSTAMSKNTAQYPYVASRSSRVCVLSSNMALPPTVIINLSPVWPKRPAQRIGPGVERWGGRREGARLRPSVDDGAPIRHYAPVFGSETTKGRPLRALHGHPLTATPTFAHGHPLTQPPTFAIVLLSGHLLASWMRRAAVIVGD